jgi:hypothetical protein
MKRWNVTLEFSATVFVAGVTAESEKAAIDKAARQHGYVSLCHHCAHELAVGDMLIDECSAEEVTPEEP